MDFSNSLSFSSNVPGAAAKADPDLCKNEKEIVNENLSKFFFSQQAHAPPPAAGRWRRQRALASVGAALCLKIHFFFEGCYIEAAQNFIEGHTIFDRDRGQKTSLTKLVLKCSVLKQSLPNSQHKLL